MLDTEGFSGNIDLCLFKTTYINKYKKLIKNKYYLYDGSHNQMV